MAIAPNTPLAVEADYTPVASEALRLYVDNALVQSKPASEVVGGVVRFEIPEGLPAGTHIIAVSAQNDTEEAKSADLVLVISVALVAPVNVRVSVLQVP